MMFVLSALQEAERAERVAQKIEPQQVLRGTT
jgi:hypothetical protein